MNEAICKEAARISKRMGSTAVLWVCEDGLVCISNLVDSRGYLFKGGRFSQLSVDHTEENSMLGLQKKLGMAEKLEEKKRVLIDEALKNRSIDNITVVLIKM